MLFTNIEKTRSFNESKLKKVEPKTFIKEFQTFIDRPFTCLVGMNENKRNRIKDIFKSNKHRKFSLFYFSHFH